MNSKGFTLLETVLTIVILGIGVSAFAILLNTVGEKSIDPMLRQQAHAVARSYLEEILIKSFCDPNLTADCPGVCNGGSTCTDTTNCTENTLGGETRATFDDICDYNGLTDIGAVDQSGSSVPDLSDFTVSVDVIDGAGAIMKTGVQSSHLS